VNSENLLRIFNENFLYDGSLGETYFLGNKIIEAVKENGNLEYSHDEKDENILAKETIRKERQEGRFLGAPFKGIESPSINMDNFYNINQMTLVVTEKCNLRCDYCPYTSQQSELFRTHGNKNMSKEVADLAIKYFVNNVSEGSGIGFYGGEPFLNFNIIKYVTNKVKLLVEKYNVNFSVTTNLNVFTKDIAQFLVENNFILVISLDGPKEIHDSHRKKANGKSSFSNLFKNLEYLKINYPDYYKNNVLTNTVLAPHLTLKK
jgi:uncharacterized protein